VGEVEIRAAPFDPGAELAAFAAGAAGAGAGAGAVVSFTGVVRGEGGLELLEIEHWPGATEAAIAAMVEEARGRFALSGARVVHRHGRLAPGEPIMMVLTAAPHRRAAFAAADFLMDWLKSRAPFWKKEHGPGGGAWVAARDEDEAALGRWADEAAPARREDEAAPG
jgi:molybdopterin synthase catalytic subunit